MKLKVQKLYLFLFFVCLQNINTFAQDPGSFYFKEAQPRKEDELTRFPGTIRGLYKSDLDSMKRLRITGDSISIEIPMVQYATFDQLKEKKYIYQDTVLVTPRGKALPCLAKNDTVFFVDFAPSVLFSRSEAQVIKKMNDVYVLSRKKDHDRWECLLVYMENSKLCVAYFDFDKKIKEIEANKKIEKANDENGMYFLANLKKKEFVKLVDANYFPVKQYFTKRFDWQ